MRCALCFVVPPCDLVPQVEHYRNIEFDVDVSTNYEYGSDTDYEGGSEGNILNMDVLKNFSFQ